MARNRKRMALYEVIGKNRVNISDSKRLEELHPETNGTDSGRGRVVDPDASMVEDQVKWPKKPRIWQLNAGRVEISIPYQLAVAVVLVVLLLTVAFYRLGQISSFNGENAGLAGSYTEESTPEPSTGAVTPASVAPPALPVARDIIVPESRTTPVAMSRAGNVIVIQSLQDRTQLEPVKKYFDKNGIETEIIAIRGTYYLVTKQRYEQNPQASGSQGYFTLQKIIKLGAEYKSPSGYPSFGSKPFSDAYGMKLNN